MPTSGRGHPHGYPPLADGGFGGLPPFVVAGGGIPGAAVIGGADMVSGGARKKLKTEEAAGAGAGGRGGRAASQQQQQQQPAAKKKKTSRACIYCQRSHLPCDSGRPCERCIKRGLAQSCRDGIRKGAVKYIDNAAGSSERERGSRASEPPSESSPSNALLYLSAPYRSMQLVSDTTSSEPPASSFTPSSFGSDVMNQEFSILGDILAMDAQGGAGGLGRLDTAVLAAGEPAPPSTSQATLDLLSAQMVDRRGVAPDEVYSRVIEPFDYSAGHHHLLEYIRDRLSREDTLRICKALVSFRPSLLAIIKNLTVNDLIFMERSFQRLIVEYSKLLAFMGTPTCVWRRTGELALVGKEFSLMTGWKAETLLDTPTYIYQLMDNASVVEYWNAYASIWHDNSQQSSITRCTLIGPDRRQLPCMACFTIKRDIFDIPLCIIGNFLPILSPMRYPAAPTSSS